MAFAANLEPKAESLDTRTGRRDADQCGRDARAPRNKLHGCLKCACTPHEFMFQPQNQERFEKLRTLSPVAAMQAWLEEDFGMGDERALMAVIRKNTPVTLFDDNRIEAIGDTMDASLDAPACLKRLAKLLRT